MDFSAELNVSNVYNKVPKGNVFLWSFNNTVFNRLVSVAVIFVSLIDSE